MKEPKILKITRTALEGIVYFVGFIKDSDKIVDIEYTCWADEAKSYATLKEITPVIKTIKDIDKEWKTYYFEAVDQEREIKETIPKWLREKRKNDKFRSH